MFDNVSSITVSVLSTVSSEWSLEAAPGGEAPPPMLWRWENGAPPATDDVEDDADCGRILGLAGGSKVLGPAAETGRKVEGAAVESGGGGPPAAGAA